MSQPLPADPATGSHGTDPLDHVGLGADETLSEANRPSAAETSTLFDHPMPDTQAESRRIVAALNATAADYPRNRLAHELIAEQAARTPDRVAVVSGDTSLTYAELDARANQFAHYLRDRGVGPDVLVGVCLDRTAEMVVALLGVWKAGGAYVPLDPDFPADRLKLYLEDSGAPVVITQSHLAGRLPTVSARVIDLDAERDAVRRELTEPVAGGGTAGNLAYVIYTSGSTGRPNGVAVEHRALVNFLVSMQREPGLTADDVVAAVTTISFDIHHLELWLPLVTGARVAVLRWADAADGVRLAEELDRFGTTVLQATPTRWRLLLAAGWGGRAGLKAFCGGEPMPPELAARLLERVAEVWNLYGPTETTVWSTVHRVESVSGSVPIGHPIANTQVYVLDQRLEQLPVGEVGELYIGGDGLARHYLNRPELTANRFVADPVNPGSRLYKTGDLARLRADGILECLGRVDHQVKVRGYRIELGEVESALATHPQLAAVVAHVTGDPAELVAYVVPLPGEAPTPESVRQHVRGRIPAYMVPGPIVFLDALPMTPNGKVDRKALPAPAAAPVPAVPGRARVAPRSDAERDLLAIWSDVFGNQDLGVTDDFFDLGGTSLKAAEVVALVSARLGHTIPLGAMYEATTVEKLAALVQRRLEMGTPSVLVPLQTGGSKPPLFMIAGVGGHVFTFHKFARTLGHDYPVYGLKAVGVDGDRRPPDTFEEIAAEYVREITAARPEGPYLLSGYSIGALVAVEVALQLQALGHKVPLVAVFDMNAPGYPPPLPFRRRLALHARNLFRPDGGVRYAVRRLKNLGNRVLRLVGLERLLFPTHPALDSLPQDALRDVWVALQTAARRYRPKGKLHGAVSLFRSEVPIDLWNAVVNVDPLLGWEQMTTGRVELHSVAMGHLEVFHPDHIDKLARQVADSIDRVAPAGRANSAANVVCRP